MSEPVAVTLLETLKLLFLRIVLYGAEGIGRAEERTKEEGREYKTSLTIFEGLPQNCVHSEIKCDFIFIAELLVLLGFMKCAYIVFFFLINGVLEPLSLS